MEEITGYGSTIAQTVQIVVAILAKVWKGDALMAWGKHAQNADKAAREADTHVKRTESRGGKDYAGRVDRATKRQEAEDLREAAKASKRR